MQALCTNYRVTKMGPKCKGLFAGESQLIRAFCRFVRAYNSLLRGANLACIHSRASNTQPIQQTVQFSPPSRLQLLMRGGVTTITCSYNVPLYVFLGQSRSDFPSRAVKQSGNEPTNHGCPYMFHILHVSQQFQSQRQQFVFGAENISLAMLQIWPCCDTSYFQCLILVAVSGKLYMKTTHQIINALLPKVTGVYG